MQRLLIAREWITGSAAMDNFSPSDTNDIIGLFSLRTATDVRLLSRAGLREIVVSKREAQSVDKLAGHER